MKHRIQIAPLSLNGHTGVICSYFDVEAKATFAILHDETVVKDPPKDALIKQVNFTETTPMVALEYDDEDKDNRIKEQVKWWLRHPEVMDVAATKGTKPHGNFARLRFTFVDLDKQVNRNSDLIRQRIDITVKLQKAGVEGRRKIATLYGVAGASQMKDDTIWEQLIGVNNTGKLANPALMWNKEKGISNMEHFQKEYKSGDEDVIFRINVLKAVEQGIVETKHNVPGDKNATTYYINNEPVAKTEDQLIIYLKEHQDLYDTYVIGALDQQDKKMKAETDKALSNSVDVMDEVSLRKRAQELKIGNWHSLKLDKLPGLIKEKEDLEAAMAASAPAAALV